MQLLFKKGLKKIVRIIAVILPEKLFNIIYTFSFNRYKSTIRFLYYLLGLLYLVMGRDDDWIMVKKIHAIIPYTMVGISGLEATYRLVNKLNSKGIAGDMIELGVAKGGCAALISSIIFDKNSPHYMERNLWLFDSYEGLPEPSMEDFKNKSTGEHVRPLPKGSCCGTLEEVKHLLFHIFDFPIDKIYFVKGWFENTIPVEQHKIQKIALLRIDADWYKSTKSCIEGFYSKVVNDGAIIVDDYESCFGCKKAIDEFLDINSINTEIILDGRGGCFFQKN